MRPRFFRNTPFILFCALALFVVTVEMRPGRLYFITTYLLFQDSLAHLLLYLLVLAASFTGLFLLLFNTSKILYRLALALLLPCLFISLTFRFITGYNFMYSDAVLSWNNLYLADTALQNYGGSAALAFGLAVLVLFLIFWARNRTAWRAAPWTAWLVPLAAIAAFALIKRTTGTVDDFPALYRVPLTVLAAVTDQVPQPVRTPVPVSPVGAGARHLFLIVDESITATELTLHQPHLQTTPFLYSVRSQLLDFGVASSLTNQSAGSNIALMSGTRSSELPDINYKTFSRTSIFQFAQKAGYTTYYLDAQLGGDVLQNFMSPEDLNYIHHVERPAVSHPQVPYHERDLLVADRLAQLAKAPGKVFVYVVKAGAHWPYARTYPADSAVFTPVLSPRSIYKDRERTLNTYHNSLRWTVDHFWRRLMGSISPADSTVVVYTSDHGQNLSQAGISLTHASVHETSPQEAAVPLWIWDPGHLTGLSPTAKPRKGYSHDHIFPTLLQLQGYSPAWVRQHYGASLLDSLGPSSQRYFLAGDIFGRGPHSLVPFQGVGSPTGQ
ncbi:sulfatase-like hydrolase/transferase [Rufibacter sediminis]|uniref:Sulfatase-like hydrolase/transferase n=1 Tax=Rufibacter sediminis TaxID=2762756 RepID=A0ABR6VT73_9BACT|nr:sulfatase-like hydrolase/transferase [Rufibacter sediminis]MBC3540395.1 sulfatase-like hydrolase/transferase [Rufibacter sediminis]